VVSTPYKLLIYINQYIHVFGLNHLLSSAAMLFIFMIFRGIFGLIFDLLI
jgi:hypothetical protein